MAAGSSPAEWGVAALAAVACIALAAWLWHRRRPHRVLRRIAGTVDLQQAPVPALAAQLDAWARARLGLARIEAAQCPPGHDPAAWAEWATTLTQLRFAPSPPDAQAALAALCETSRGWKRHV